MDVWKGLGQLNKKWYCLESNLEGGNRKMKIEEKKVLTAPCGLDCFNCELYDSNLTDEFATLIHQKYGVPKEAIPCRGCRIQNGEHYHIPDGCATLDCVKEKGVDLCSDCVDFPCQLLGPIADGASIYPHNMKVYNLCRIKTGGIENWIHEAGQIRQKYFKGKFIVGKGQSD